MPPNVAAFRHGMPWSNSVHKASNWNIFVPIKYCLRYRFERSNIFVGGA